jgi:Flp pilus assembly protein TadG
MIGLARTMREKLASLRADKGGTAAIEFGLFVGLLSFSLLNTVDVSVYLYQRMQVENATEMAAEAAFKACDLSSLPATTKCAGLTTAITNAVQSTSLGKKVTLQSGSPSEGYYCVDNNNALQYVSDVSTKPADCTAAGMPSLKPSDYINISTTFTYKPLFSGVTIAGLLTTPVTSTAWMRLD